MSKSKSSSVPLGLRFYDSIPFNEMNHTKTDTDHEPTELVFDSSLFIHKLAIYLLAHKQPKRCLAVLLYATGFDVGAILGCNNNQADICKTMNIKPNNFIWLLKEIKSELQIDRTPRPIDNKRKDFVTGYDSQTT